MNDNLSDDDGGMKLGLRITRGAPGSSRKFAGKLKPTPYRVIDIVGGKKRTLDESDDRIPSFLRPALPDNSERSFRIPKYEAWHESRPFSNPYKHYFFPSTKGKILLLELGHSQSWNDMKGEPTTMTYNTEHVFEVQQLTSYLQYLLKCSGLVLADEPKKKRKRHECVDGDGAGQQNLQSQQGNTGKPNSPMQNMGQILFDPECNPVRSWPFHGSGKTFVAQLLADCLPNHRSGIQRYDFVYLEARINKMKGLYSRGGVPKALNGKGSVKPPNVTLLKLWSSLAETILVKKYMNHEIVVTKYNHVSRRMRKMMHEIDRRAREDHSRSEGYDLWKSWEMILGGGRMVPNFNAWETGFLDEMGKKMQTAINTGLERMANFEPSNDMERELYSVCIRELAEHGYKTFNPFASVKPFNGALSTYGDRYDVHSDKDLDAHVSQTERGELEKVRLVEMEGDETKAVDRFSPSADGSESDLEGWGQRRKRQRLEYEARLEREAENLFYCIPGRGDPEFDRW